MVVDMLTELGIRFGTDKAPGHIPYGDVNHVAHPYTPVYWELFKDLREQPITMLEVGVSEGYSIRMWREFFPLAKIFGWDNAIHRFEGEIPADVYLDNVDQSDTASLIGAWRRQGKPTFDVIIDDGSHVFPHQVTTLNAMLPTLAPHGIYVIEDETSPLTVPPAFTNDVRRWKDPRDMMQIIRRKPLAYPGTVGDQPQKG